MRELGLGKRHVAPIVLPGLIVDPPQACTLRRQVTQVTGPDCEPHPGLQFRLQLAQPVRSFAGVTEPPRIQIHCLAKTPPFEELGVIARVVRRKDSGRILKTVDQ